MAEDLLFIFLASFLATFDVGPCIDPVEAAKSGKTEDLWNPGLVMCLISSLSPLQFLTEPFVKVSTPVQVRDSASGERGGAPCGSFSRRRVRFAEDLKHKNWYNMLIVRNISGLLDELHFQGIRACYA